MSPIINLHLGWHFLYSRQYDRAIEQLSKTLELDPEYALAHWYLGLAYEQKKMYAQALREMNKAKELLPKNLAVLCDIGHLYAVSGDTGNAEKIIAALRRESAQRYVNQYELALIYLGLGRNDEAFRYLERAHRQRSDMLVYLKVDPRFDSVHSDPRFAELLRGVGVPN